MTNYTLDISKWRCGGDNGEHLVNSLFPEQHTEMQNKEGKMCCLGQFAKQCKLQKRHLIDIGSPDDVAYHFGKNYDINFVVQGIEDCHNNKYNNTPLAKKLIHINDDSDTTIETKIKRMTKLLEKNGHTIEVIGWEWLEKKRAAAKKVKN